MITRSLHSYLNILSSINSTQKSARLVSTYFKLAFALVHISAIVQRNSSNTYHLECNNSARLRGNQTCKCTCRNQVHLYKQLFHGYNCEFHWHIHRYLIKTKNKKKKQNKKKKKKNTVTWSQVTVWISAMERHPSDDGKLQGRRRKFNFAYLTLKSKAQHNLHEWFSFFFI